tara:strand:+ start:21697 stop:23004 length:1308 start_codon:yes stop_codon:yes gene_type:complete
MTELIYKKRRDLLSKAIKDNSVVILQSPEEKIRNNDVYYTYRQCSNFYYLTGYNEPLSILLLKKQQGKTKTFFYSTKPNKQATIWTGNIDSAEKIKKNLQIDKCQYLEKFDNDIARFLENSKNIYYLYSDQSNAKKIIDKHINLLEKKYRTGIGYPTNFISLKNILHSMRIIKSKKELSVIRNACSISVNAHKRLMRKCKPNINEYEMHAELMHEFIKSNATEAYPSIVASGKNACILHYTNNKSTLKNGDLLLVDAAAEYDNYASDITRTIPINGKFSKYQKIIYNIVLKAQKNAIKKCIVGNTLYEVHNEAVKTITKELIKIGFIKTTLSKALKSQEYKKFYMHNTGHWLGLDVHDPCEYKENGKFVKLKQGMVFTVEPGIYIRKPKGISSKFHNIGIRIEDDVLVTNKEPEVLTIKLPKEIKDIENIMSKDD